MLTYRIFPLTGGDSLFNWGLFQALREITDIEVFSLISEGYADHKAGIHFYSSEATDATFDPRLFQDVCSYIEEKHVDIVLISHVLMYRYLRPLKRKYPELEYIYVSHNAEYENAIAIYDWNTRSIPSAVRPAYRAYVRLRLNFLKRRERIMLTESSKYFSISEYDVQMHKKTYGRTAPSFILKPIIEFPCNKTEEDYADFGKKLLIVGSMSWFPNVKGTLWFCEKVMPVLVGEGYSLYIVGNHPADELIRLSQKDPEHYIVTGKVPTVDEYFEKCDISIVPLFEGTGTKIKVLESMGRGILTVATSFAAKDYNINDEIFVADTAEEFISCIHALSESEELRRRKYRDMRAFYQKHNRLPDEIKDIFR